MDEPFLNVICSNCRGTGDSGLYWPDDKCYPCGGTGKMLRPYVLADNPWIASE